MDNAALETLVTQVRTVGDHAVAVAAKFPPNAIARLQSEGIEYIETDICPPTRWYVLDRSYLDSLPDETRIAAIVQIQDAL